MSEMTKGRNFQLWEYHVSHGSLLIRSPVDLNFDLNIDIICTGVEYIAAPRHLGEITVCSPEEEDVKIVEGILRKKVPPSRVWVLKSSHARFLIAAASLQVREYRGGRFDSPFAEPHS